MYRVTLLEGTIMKVIEGYVFDEDSYRFRMTSFDDKMAIIERLSAALLMLIYFFLLIVVAHFLSAFLSPPRNVGNIGSIYFHVHQLDSVITICVAYYIIYLLTICFLPVDFYGLSRNYFKKLRIVRATFKFLMLIPMMISESKK